MLRSGFDYEGLLGLDVFEDETGPIEMVRKQAPLC